MYLCLFSQGTAIFDFSDTGYEVHGNCNAPRAVTLSGLIYCLRSMVGHDIPLNQVTVHPDHLTVHYTTSISNNNNMLYSSQWEIKAVIRSHNKEHISVILDIRPLSLNLQVAHEGNICDSLMISVSQP